MIEGLVSTVIPVHNRSRLLIEAVQSVLDQSYRPIEIIVVDDGSTDSTGDVVDQLSARHRKTIVAIHIANRGPGLAREVGRQAANGEFVQYLDSDDVLLPEKFERQALGLLAHPDCGVSYGWTQYRHADGTVETSPWKGSGERVETMLPSFLRSRWWDTPTPLYRSTLLDQAGPWSDLRLEEDWEYDTRVGSLGVRLHYCEVFVAQVRDHDDQRLSRGKLSDAKRQQERARAHTMIYANAVRAGVTSEVPEMAHFARELFLLSRQCGAAGLASESKALFDLSRKASGLERAGKLDFVVYNAAGLLLGWKTAGRLACFADRLRP